VGFGGGLEVGPGGPSGGAKFRRGVAGGGRFVAEIIDPPAVLPVPLNGNQDRYGKRCKHRTPLVSLSRSGHIQY
jgi:hypothetical protein